MISKIRIFALSAFSLFSISSLAAQEIKPVDVYQDPNGIDLVSNNVSTSQIPVLAIPAAPELEFQDLADFIPLLEVVTGDQALQFDPNIYTVSAGRLGSDVFALCQSEMCIASNGTGGMLVNTEVPGSTNPPEGIGCEEFCPPPIYVPLPGDIIGTGGVTYRAGDTGRAIYFNIETEIASGTLPQRVKKYLAEEIRNPGGVDLSIQYQSLNVGGILRHRPATVTSTSGYQLRFTYLTNASDLNWGVLRKAEIVLILNPNEVLASHTYSANTVTDIANRVFECVCQIDIYPTRPKDRGSRMRLPGETEYALTTFRQQGTNTRTVTADGVTFQYASTPDNGWSNTDDAIHDITVTGPNGFHQFIDVTNIQATTGQFDPPRRRIESITDALGRRTTYQYTPNQRLKSIIYPEGNSVSVVYDSFGNLVSRTDIPKSLSGLSPITQSASYSGVACGVEGFDCYFPEWTQDGNGNRTDFTWGWPGLLLTQLDPPHEGGKRRKVKNTWSGLEPISGETCPALLQYGLPGPPQCTPRLLREEICETDTNGNELTCGTASSFVRQFTYFRATSLPESETVTDGAGNGPLTTIYSYDNAGRQLSADGPLTGSDDAVYMRYDVIGRKTWEIGPRSANGLRLAKRYTYRNADDQVTKVENGTVTSPTDTVLAVLDEAITIYNARRLPVEQRVVSGLTTYSVSQTSYDALNRPECAAVRMNPAAYSSLPASACTFGTQGAQGADRITRTVYDAADQVLQIRKGVGTLIEIADVTYSYTPNGKIAQVVDANGNRAELRYDGHDRQAFWVFPSKTRSTAFNGATPATALATAGALNEGDFEQYFYDSNGNRTRLRKRDGHEIVYAYDALNRVTVKDVCADPPSLFGRACADPSSVHHRDVYYAYDLRGLQTKARFSSITGVGITYAYDTFGRLTSETQNTDGVSRTVASQYDANGQRTRVTYPDSRFFTFDVDASSRVTGLRDGTNAIGSISYDNRGLPTQMAWTAGTASANRRSYGYDPAGRLSSIGFDLHGSVGDVTWSYTRNPASQIVSEVESNSSYAWDGHLNVTRAYTTNGLNQYQSAGSAAFCYDANGNLTADGSSVYRYDVENRLVEKRAQGTGNINCDALSYAGALQAQLLYDPTGRLYQVSGGPMGIQRFVYDGNAMIAEYNGSNVMLRRHVHGSNIEADDPLLWYEGSTQTATARRYVHTDPRGSIVAVTDHTGNRTQINTYDEYGIPDGATQTDAASGGSNGIATKGRFRYTGQAWIPELGMYYYKARIYSPTLGRFLQTDPIGYEDQFNLYAYVGNDPINGVDPTGRERLLFSFDLRAAEALGIDGSIEAAFDLETFELGLALEGGAAAGAGLTVEAGFETEASSEKGTFGAVEAAINADANAGVRAGSSLNFAGSANAREGIRAATDGSSGRVSEREVAVAVGPDQLSTTGGNTPPNKAAYGTSITASLTFRGEVNISGPEIINVIKKIFE